MRMQFDREARAEIGKAVAIAGLSALVTKLAEVAVEHGAEWVKKQFAPPPRDEESK